VYGTNGNPPLQDVIAEIIHGVWKSAAIYIGDENEEAACLPFYK